MGRRKKEAKPEVPTIEKQPNAEPREKFVPRPCSDCAAVRPANTSYSRVITTRGRIRYCKCGYCGSTWTQAISFDARNTMPVVTRPATELQTGTDTVPLKHVADRNITSTSRSSDQRLTNGRGVVLQHRQPISN